MPTGRYLRAVAASTGELAEQRQTPLSHSYCQYVVADDAPLVVPDARLDDRLRDNPAIAEYDAIVYAGIPLRSPDGQVLGSFCVVDSTPRAWTQEQVAILTDLAAAAEAEIALRLAVTKGCVIPNFAPRVFFKKSETPALVNHVRLAQRTGLPGAGGPLLENEPGWDKRLTRLANESIHRANNNRACPSGIGPKSGAPDTTSCDEYPMASTRQGAYTVSPSSDRPRWFRGCNIKYPATESVRSGPVGYSRCFIPYGENTEQARIMKRFYETSDKNSRDLGRFRILHGDAFFVALI